MTQEQIKQIIRNFPRKYQYGFTSDEIKELLKSFPNMNMDKFDDALSYITAIFHEKQTLLYPHDIYNAIVCGIENRDLDEFEFD
jgi:hypothetical protein